MSTIPPNAIQISRPDPKAISEVQVPPKAYLNFMFSLQGADSSKQGDDLVIELPDGSKVVCLGYYSNTAEGDRPQIAVNGEALPPSALDVRFFNQQVEGVRVEGDPQGTDQGGLGEQGAQNAGEVAGQEAGAGGKAPASSGATATGESANAGQGQGAEQGAGQGAGQSGQAAGQGSPASASSSGSSSDAGTTGNEGGLKLDHNVDFLGGINRLPGLDLGSDRGFDRTDIESGPIWGGGTSTTPPPSATPPTPPVVPPQGTIFKQISGLKEEGTKTDGTVDTAGTDSAGHTFTLQVPDGVDPSDITLDFSLFPGAPSGPLTPGTDYNTNYGKFSYTVTPNQVPVLNADGTPMLDAGGNPVLRWEVDISFTYDDLDNTNSTINGLPDGGKLNEDMSFTVTGKNPDGSKATIGSGDVSFVIEGSNDGPKFTLGTGNLAAQVEVKEEGVYNDNKGTQDGEWDSYLPGNGPNHEDYGTHKSTTTVQLGATDSDAGDSLTYSLTSTNVTISGGTNLGNATLVQNANGSYTLMIGTEACGTMTLSASGALSFTLDSNASLIQAMKAGDFSELKLTVTVTDKGGLTDTGDVTLTIHGTNDKPSFTVPVGGIDIIESGDNVNHATKGGTLVGTDPERSTTEFYIAKDATVAGKDKLDSGDTLGTMDGQYGSLVLNKDGSYTYTENGSLRAGETRQDTFTVLVKDENGAFTTKELTFNVEGKNNQVTFAPSGGDNYVISLVEEGVISGGNTPNTPGSSAGDLGAKIVAEGNITKLPGGNDFIVDDDAIAGPGVANGRTFSLTKSDGSPSDLVIKSTSGPDTAGNQIIETEYGYFNFNIYSGAYTYTLKDVGYLTKDDIKTEIFTVNVYKGGVLQGERDFSVTISGMNDKPEFGTLDNLVVTAQGSANTGVLIGSSTATSSDVDRVDTRTYTIENTVGDKTLLVQAIKGEYGVLELDPNTGLYTYKLDNERATTKALGLNQKGEETFTFRVTDAAGAYDTITITVTVNGAYDEPVISYGGKSIAEDAPTVDRTVDGDISISTTDAVHGDNTPNGKSFTLVNADGSIPAKDANAMQTITTAYGTLEFNTLTGHYTYTLSDAGNILLQGKNIGDIVNQDFTVRVTFPEAGGSSSTVGTTINVDLTGVNDAPKFTSDGEITLEMDRVFVWEQNESIVGTVEATDVDNTGATELTFFFKGPNGEVLYTIETPYGRVSINPQTGEYTYLLDPNNPDVKGLNAGRSLEDTFTVTVRDPHGLKDTQKINVTINGRDDTAPGEGPGPGDGGFILPDNPLHVKEDGGGSNSGTGQEDNSSPTLPSGTGVRYAFIKVDADGNPIMGTDGKPEMTQSLKGEYGDIYIDAHTGQYRYVLNNQLLSVQEMMKDAKAFENFLVYGFTIGAGNQPEWVMDGANLKEQGKIKVTVEGTNDDPILTHTVTAQGLLVYAGTPSGGNSIKTGGEFTATDVDLNDTKTFGLSAGDPQTGAAACGSLDLVDASGITWGTVTIGADGKYEFAYNPQDFSGTKTLTFWVYVKDSTGAIDKEEVTITITTANTKPVIISCTYTEGTTDTPSYVYGSAAPNLGIDHSNGNVQLGGVDLTQGSALIAGMKESTTTLKGQFGAWDNEVTHGGQSPTSFAYFLKEGSEYENLVIKDYGSLNLSQNGSFTFTLNNQSDMVKALQQGQTKTLTYKVVVRDANGAYSGEQDFQIVITGTNNTPEITATQRLITMTESGNVLDDAGNILTGTPKFELKVDDADLYKTDGNGNVIDKSVQAGHNFVLNGTGTGKGNSNIGDLTITGGKQSDGSSYVFTVGDGTNTYGTFHITVNPNDAADVTYWFVVNPSMKDYLTQNDNVTLNFKVNFNDGFTGGISNDTSVNVVIKGENFVPDIIAPDTNIVLAEDGVDSHHTLTITDKDLGADITGHDFDLVGKEVAGNKTTIGAETRSNDGSLYNFEVKQGGELYGKLHIQVDPTNPKNVEYWFEVDGSVKDRLFDTNTINLNFDIVFKDEYGGVSTGKNINVTISGAGAAPPVTTTTVLDADLAPDTQDPAQAQGVQNSAEASANAAAPNAAPDTALAEASATPLVAALGAPDMVLPGMDLALLIHGQDGQGTTPVQQGNTLETPLPEAPPPDLTSAPGQEALQFQLQTTGL